MNAHIRPPDPPPATRGNMPKPTTRALSFLVLGTLAAGAGAAQESADPYVVRDLAPGVFAVMGPADVPSSLFANSLVVMGAEGVMVVDSGDREELARAIVRLIRERTDLPVRWLVNTHWHGDHVWGNAVFQEAFPHVRILATPSTRDSVAVSSARQVGEQLEQQRGGRARLAEMMDTADPALQIRIRRADSVRVARIAELERLRIVPPTDTFTQRVEVDLGGRTAVLLPLGPAHTPGDAAVWLPEERIVAVGDLLEEGELWLEGSDLEGWRRALDVLGALDSETVLPSHGDVSEDGGLLEAGRAQLRNATARPRHRPRRPPRNERARPPTGRRRSARERERPMAPRVLP